MKKNITILSLLIGIYLMFPLFSFAQTTEQNQNIACNNLPNGSSCKYKVQLSNRNPENGDIEGRCDRRGDGRLYCNNTLTGWEDCFDRSQSNDACKDKSSGKIGACVQQGSGSNLTCDTTKTPTGNPVDSTPGGMTIICVANAEKDNKCGTASKCTGNQVCANVDGTTKCVTNAEKDNKCGTGNKCTGNQVCVSQTSSSNGSNNASSSTANTSSATTTAGTVTYESYTNFPGIGRISNLCQLITALWLLGFAVLLTSVLGMFLYGGYIYVTAGVNAGKVNQAKEIFTNTITGLIIGLSIFIIINVINPGLLQGNCSIPPIGSTGTGADQPTLGGPGTSVPGNRNCDGCVSLRSQGVTVANWNGTNGPGRTDKVMPQVAVATKRVQDAMAALGTPIHITAAWSNGVGHSAGSQHYQGLAVDMQSVSGGARNNATLQQIANECRKAGFTFVLVESYHTHCDMR